MFKTAVASPAFKKASTCRTRSDHDLLSFELKPTSTVPTTVQVETVSDVASASKEDIFMTTCTLPDESTAEVPTSYATYGAGFSSKKAPAGVTSMLTVKVESTNPTTPTWEQVDSNYARLWKEEEKSCKAAETKAE
jgi:hypothetical protein